MSVLVCLPSPSRLPHFEFPPFSGGSAPESACSRGRSLSRARRIRICLPPCRFAEKDGIIAVFTAVMIHSATCGQLSRPIHTTPMATLCGFHGNRRVCGVGYIWRAICDPATGPRLLRMFYLYIPHPPAGVRTRTQKPQATNVVDREVNQT